MEIVRPVTHTGITAENVRKLKRHTSAPGGGLSVAAIWVGVVAPAAAPSGPVDIGNDTSLSTDIAGNFTYASNTVHFTTDGIYSMHVLARVSGLSAGDAVEMSLDSGLYSPPTDTITVDGVLFASLPPVPLDAGHTERVNFALTAGSGSPTVDSAAFTIVKYG